MNLTNYQQALITGILLGDGHLQLRSDNEARLRVAHGIKQKNYVFWKYKQLIDLCVNTQRPAYDPSSQTYWFQTQQSSILYFYHCMFYKPIYSIEKQQTTYVKTITSNLIDFLQNMDKKCNHVVLAVWFMDDGSVRNDCYSGKLATHNFSYQQQELLKFWLQKVGIPTSIICHTKKSGQWYLSIPAQSFQNWVLCIESTVVQIPEMVYKLNQKRKPKHKKRNPLTTEESMIMSVQDGVV
jgi:hypothetical protein